jgi:hypothetical protein
MREEYTLDMYNAYVRANKRKIIAEEGITYERALDFLSETNNALVIDASGKEYIAKEELEYAKSVRSLPGTGADSFVTSRREVHEDPHRELLEALRDKTESSSKRDN